MWGRISSGNLFGLWLMGATAAVRQEEVPEFRVERDNCKTTCSEKPLLPLRGRGVPDGCNLVRGEVMADPVREQRVFDGPFGVALQ
jgi:hypothetical protein